MADETRQKILSQINHLRALVGYLGESSQFNWWDTSFLNEIGLQFLAINFPRSFFSAGVNSVATAARKLHDERIGKGGVYHLFRLPAVIEETLHSMLLNLDAETIVPDLADTDQALSRLNKFVKRGVSAPDGPVQIGHTGSILVEFTIQELAAHYFDAFRSNKRCFPYFMAE
jgi:hypothetical protein